MPRAADATRGPDLTGSDSAQINKSDEWVSSGSITLERSQRVHSAGSNTYVHPQTASTSRSTSVGSRSHADSEVGLALHESSSMAAVKTEADSIGSLEGERVRERGGEK